MIYYLYRQIFCRLGIPMREPIGRDFLTANVVGKFVYGKNNFFRLHISGRTRFGVRVRMGRKRRLRAKGAGDGGGQDQSRVQVNYWLPEKQPWKNKKKLFNFTLCSLYCDCVATPVPTTVRISANFWPTYVPYWTVPLPQISFLNYSQLSILGKRLKLYLIAPDTTTALIRCLRRVPSVSWDWPPLATPPWVQGGGWGSTTGCNLEVSRGKERKKIMCKKIYQSGPVHRIKKIYTAVYLELKNTKWLSNM